MLSSVKAGTLENQDAIKSDILAVNELIEPTKSVATSIRSKTIRANNDAATIQTQSNNITDDIDTLYNGTQDSNDVINTVNDNLLTMKDDVTATKNTMSSIKTVSDDIKSDVNVTINNDLTTSMNNLILMNSKLNDIGASIDRSKTTATSAVSKADSVKSTATRINASCPTKENENEIYNILNAYAGSKSIKRYGVKIKKGDSDPFTRVQYTYDAVGLAPAHINRYTGNFDYGGWKDIWFVRDNFPCMLTYDGRIAEKLNPNDYTKKIDGSASSVADTSFNGNAMSRIPLVWLSFTEDSTYEYITACEEKYDDTYEPVGFINDSGVVQPEMFLSMYQGYATSNTLRSLRDKNITTQKSFQGMIQLARANGNGWYIRTWAQRTLINALLVIMGKSDDSQSSFGYGMTYIDHLSGRTDSTYGQFSNNSYNANEAYMRLFHIENWWGGYSEQIAGLMYTNSSLYYKMHGPYISPSTVLSDYTDAGYNKLPVTISTGNGYISNSKLGYYGRIPIAMSGSSTTYQPDKVYYNSGTYLWPFVGGTSEYYSSGDPNSTGAFRLGFDGASVVSTTYAAGLSYINP